VPLRTHHWFDFDTLISYKGDWLTVRVEATISSSSSGVEIEGVKIKMLDSDVQLVLDDKQMKRVREEIVKRCLK
jgi:hypothetical protein